MKNKNLFLFGAFLLSSGLIFSAQANESDIISEVDAEPTIVEISPLEVTDVATSTVAESNVIDYGSNNSGTYHIGEGDIGQSIPGVNDVDIQFPSEDKPVKTEKAPDIMVDYKQVKFEPLNYQQQSNTYNTYVEENEPIDLNYNVDEAKETKQELVDSVSSVKEEEEPVEVSTVNEQTVVEKRVVDKVQSDEVDTEKVGKLIDLRQEDKPIGKITRLKAELPLTGMMNTKQGIVASLILMLSGLISLLYGFSRKYLG